MSVKVSCINKDDRYSPYERISHIGGINPNGTRWRMTSSEAIKAIINKTYEFYVEVNGDRVNVVLGERQGKYYLKTEADGDEPNNLLSLVSCPLY